ncbi:MAG: hypothetical protein ISR77_38960 [Pirellulaceae bacterium]|nr:hypothetical protein [Pirellulaceae bacterium]
MKWSQPVARGSQRRIGAWCWQPASVHRQTRGVLWRCCARDTGFRCPLVLIALMPFGDSAMTSGLPVISAVLIAVAAWSALMPERGVPGRIAGTYLVPR